MYRFEVAQKKSDATKEICENIFACCNSPCCLQNIKCKRKIGPKQLKGESPKGRHQCPYISQSQVKIPPKYRSDNASKLTLETHQTHTPGNGGRNAQRTLTVGDNHFFNPSSPLRDLGANPWVIASYLAPKKDQMVSWLP